MTRRTEWLDRHESVTMKAAMASHKAGEVCNSVAYKALQIHGGYGYMEIMPLNG